MIPCNAKYNTQVVLKMWWEGRINVLLTRICLRGELNNSTPVNTIFSVQLEIVYPISLTPHMMTS